MAKVGLSPHLSMVITIIKPSEIVVMVAPIERFRSGAAHCRDSFGQMGDDQNLWDVLSTIASISWNERGIFEHCTGWLVYTSRLIFDREIIIHFPFSLP